MYYVLAQYLTLLNFQYIYTCVDTHRMYPSLYESLVGMVVFKRYQFCDVLMADRDQKCIKTL